MNAGEFFLARSRPSAVALVDGARSHTYGELRAAVAALADRLDAVGAPARGRVGIAAPNSFFWVAAYLAVLSSGRVAVPFATVTPPQDVARQAVWTGCSAFLAASLSARRLGDALAGGPVVTEDALLASDGQGPAAWRPIRVAPDDDAVLQLTSGTTSAPKAVRVTHRNLQANTGAIVEYLGLADDDRMLVVLPFSYCFGASLLHSHLRAGASVVLCHTMTYPETVVEALAEHACTGFAGVPSTYQVLLRASSLRSRRLPALRHLQQAGGRLAAPLVDDLAAAQPHARVFVMYGQTEATARLSYLDPGEMARRRGSVGRGIPGQRLRVVDDEGRDVRPGETGEIVASGPSVTKGYWRDPEATAAKYRDGLLRTGDLGTVDDGGYVYVLDRIADFVKTWGFRVSSQEVEEAALQVPGVVSAAAIGVPDDDAGEVVVLFVVGSGGVPDGAPDAAEVLAALRRRLPKHAVPRRVHLLDALPLNANGKPVKSRLRELAARG